MRLTADTNLLVRHAVRDDERQADAADVILRRAEFVAIPTPALCEFVWVLRRTYGFPTGAVVSALRRLLSIAAVRVDRVVADAGIAALEAGGDFADACIATEGRRMGGAMFTSFDRRAVAVVMAAGGEAQLLTSSSQSH